MRALFSHNAGNGGKELECLPFVYVPPPGDGARASDSTCIIYTYRPKHRGRHTVSLWLAANPIEPLAASPYAVSVEASGVNVPKAVAFGPALEPLTFDGFPGALEPQLELGADALFSVEFNGEKPPPAPLLEMPGNRLLLPVGGDSLLVDVKEHLRGTSFVHYKFSPPDTGVCLSVALITALIAALRCDDCDCDCDCICIGLSSTVQNTRPYSITRPNNLHVVLVRTRRTQGSWWRAC